LPNNFIDSVYDDSVVFNKLRTIKPLDLIVDNAGLDDALNFVITFRRNSIFVAIILDITE